MGDTYAPLPFVSKEFNDDYLAARQANAEQTTRLTLESVPFDRRVTMNRYKFKFFLSDYTFEIRCIPSTPISWMGVCSSSYNHTNVKLRRYPKDSEDKRDRKKYKNVHYESPCDEMTCRYLMYYTTCLTYNFDELELIKVPGMTKFNEGHLLSAKRITLNVQTSTSYEDLVGNWLKTIQCDPLHNLVINAESSSRNVEESSNEKSIVISSNETARNKLKTVNELTINGGAIIDTEFLQEFRGLLLTYNDTEHDLPISYTEIVEFWKSHEPTVAEHKKIIFNTKQPIDNFDEIQQSLRSKKPQNEEVRIFTRESLKFTDKVRHRTFKMSETQLVMEWNIPYLQ